MVHVVLGSVIVRLVGYETIAVRMRAVTLHATGTEHALVACACVSLLIRAIAARRTFAPWGALRALTGVFVTTACASAQSLCGRELIAKCRGAMWSASTDIVTQLQRSLAVSATMGSKGLTVP